MREVDANAQIPQRLPNISHLLALAYAVGGNEGAAHGVVVHIFRSLHVPARNVVHVAAVLRATEHVDQLGLLLLGLVARAQKRWVTDDIAAFLGRQYFLPVHTKRVALVDIVVAFQRQEVEGLQQNLLRCLHHLLLGYPQRRFCNADREVVYLYAEKLIDGNLYGAALPVEADAHLIALQIFEHTILKLAQGKVAFSEEVAAAACWVEHVYACEFSLERAQPHFAIALHAVAFNRRKLGAQIVQEQRVNNLVDVLNTGVVHTARAPRGGVQSALEGRAEDGGADVTPVEALRRL